MDGIERRRYIKNEMLGHPASNIDIVIELASALDYYTKYVKTESKNMTKKRKFSTIWTIIRGKDSFDELYKALINTLREHEITNEEADFYLKFASVTLHNVARAVRSNELTTKEAFAQLYTKILLLKEA